MEFFVKTFRSNHCWFPGSVSDHPLRGGLWFKVRDMIRIPIPFPQFEGITDTVPYWPSRRQVAAVCWRRDRGGIADVTNWSAVWDRLCSHLADRTRTSIETASIELISLRSRIGCKFIPPIYAGRWGGHLYSAWIHLSPDNMQLAGVFI